MGELKFGGIGKRECGFSAFERRFMFHLFINLKLDKDTVKYRLNIINFFKVRAELV